MKTTTLGITGLEGHPIAYGTWQDDDWRSGGAVFKGEEFESNLDAVRRLGEPAEERGTTVSRLAIAWTLANVAIVGARRGDHPAESVGAADIRLGEEDMRADRADHERRGRRGRPVAGDGLAAIGRRVAAAEGRLVGVEVPGR